MKKNLAKIGIGGLILSALIVGLLFFLNNRSIKQIAGVSIELPPFSTNSLIRPPVKVSSYTEPSIFAKSAILMDTASAYVLYEKNADSKVPIASTTKMMTAMVVLENHQDKLNDSVTISSDMINVEGSKVQLLAGEKIKVYDLLQGLLIPSGNDAAYSLAGYFGGKAAFVNEMNNKAAFLGLAETHYQDPAGLNDEGYSTARDLAFLANYALKNPTFLKIVSTPAVTIYSTNGAVSHELKTSNRLLQADDSNYYSYALGVKTGFTYAAGHCLVSSAKKDGHQLIGVILNTNASTITASAEESKKLLEWGFDNWTW